MKHFGWPDLSGIQKIGSDIIARIMSLHDLREVITTRSDRSLHNDLIPVNK